MSDESFKAAVRSALEKHGSAINRSELARVVDVSPQAISQFMKKDGKKPGTLAMETVEKIADFLSGHTGWVGVPGYEISTKSLLEGGLFKPVISRLEWIADDIRLLIVALACPDIQDADKAQRLDSEIRIVSAFFEAMRKHLADETKGSK